ncbi:hypothetical protein A0H81_14224 [Grifola frondosa]|uniref:Aminotransferase class I/classII large domain-containing protein n=1 Tax=Grifola frondosa TaxID=5627 RepID=A0A1C7LLY3_GRIFR|nr:hypothetical protein A0H81_14224 [Grifola frondosa]
MDDGGLIPEELERILANWNEERGRRPHVLYTVPCGQNPTGSTLSLERRKQIYEIAQRFDLIIIEDDPYYFLQYDSPTSQTTSLDSPFMPSFLSLDVDGRVMRVDSKIMAPGMRLGWITSNPGFHEHLVSYTDSSTQHPHGFGQILITELLGAHGWQIAGFDRWVRSLRTEYHRRRGFFLDLFAREVASTALASASSPEAGMFVWIRVNVEQHPRFRSHLLRGRTGDGSVARTNMAQLMDELFEKCLDNGLVIMPASIFALAADPKYDDRGPHRGSVQFPPRDFCWHGRIYGAGLAILGTVLREFFAEEQK